ncbi:MAG: chemotaxis protein CheA [Pseudomonas sp.]
MSFDADEEILQDFLVEAGEILELLSEQLVELENRPSDADLLNAIFRGFHTVKGGAGFLQLDALVTCCHIAENVFDILRKGERQVDAELMDVVLQALDNINSMFAQVRDGQQPTPAEPALLEALSALARPAAEQPVQPSTPVAAETVQATVEHSNEAGSNAMAEGDITDDEFELLLEALHVAPEQSSEADAGSASASAGSDEITDDEFEALLDQLHGTGKGPGADAALSTEAPALAGGHEELITDDEFESLLDELHGAGKGPGAEQPAAEQPAAMAPPTPTPVKAAPSPAAPAAVAKPIAKPERKPEPGTEPVAADTTVRVDTARLDDIMNMVGELVLVRNRLTRLGADSEDEELAKAVANLDMVTADLQASVMKTRMQPIKKVFGRFPRVVRDLSRNLKKEIALQLIGEETDLDKNLVEALADPLVHLVRNSVDHGIEMPDEREAAGKPRSGTIVLAARQEGDHILLTITDDGKGMDAEVLRAKAVEKGMMDRDAADRLSEAECFNLILAAGFSTKTEVSDVSGRGVGMDVVRTRITQLNGTIAIDSTKGKGTQIAIKVPLTLAIMPTLMVMLGSQAFALPLVNVNEIYSLDLSRTNVVDGQEVILVREKALPLFWLKRWLIPGASADVDRTAASVVIVSVGTQRVGFVVDQLVGQEEVVIKPLGCMLHGTVGMAGATITGDGRIALILDIPGLLKRYARRG